MNQESLVKPENFGFQHPSEESRHSYCEADIPKAKATIGFATNITNVGKNLSPSRVTILHDPMLGLSVPVDDHNPEARRKGPRFLDIQRRAWPPRHQKWRISTTRRQPNTQQCERAKPRASQNTLYTRGMNSFCEPNAQHPHNHAPKFSDHTGRNSKGGWQHDAFFWISARGETSFSRPTSIGSKDPSKYMTIIPGLKHNRKLIHIPRQWNQVQEEYNKICSSQWNLAQELCIQTVIGRCTMKRGSTTCCWEIWAKQLPAKGIASSNSSQVSVSSPYGS